MFIDVTPQTLGIELAGGIFSPLITKNTSIPASMVKTYTNSDANQELIAVKIYQGDPPMKGDKQYCADCVLISEFDLGGFAGYDKGKASV